MTFGGTAKWLRKDTYFHGFDRAVWLRHSGNANERASEEPPVPEALNASIASKWISVGPRAPRVAISMIFGATVSVAQSDSVLRPRA
jgi:hypothetical protein